jgi:hypothetical protein
MKDPQLSVGYRWFRSYRDGGRGLWLFSRGSLPLGSEVLKSIYNGIPNGEVPYDPNDLPQPRKR